MQNCRERCVLFEAISFGDRSEWKRESYGAGSAFRQLPNSGKLREGSPFAVASEVDLFEEL